MKKHLKLGTLALSLLGLTACGSVANQTPDQMYLTSMQRQFKQDTQYNFTGKMFAQILPSETDDKPSQAREDKLAHLTQYLIEREKCECEGDESKMPKTAELRQQAERKLSSQDALTQHFVDSISLPMSGAWDLPNGKFEVVPEIRYETRNSAAYMKLPIQINAKEANILIDPAAVSPFIDRYASEKKADFTAINNRYVRITLPEQARQILPLKDIFHSLPKALGDAHAVLDKSQFSSLPLDERAKRLGATHKIAYTSNSKQDEAYVAALFKSVLAQVEEKHKNGTAQSRIPAENYQKFLDGMKHVAQSVEKSSEQVEPVAEENELASLENMMKNMRTNTEMYLNNQGRMLAYVQYVDLPTELTERFFYGKRVRVMSEMEMQYNAKPVFQIQANESNTVDLTEIAPEFKAILDKFSEESDKANKAAEKSPE